MWSRTHLHAHVCVSSTSHTCVHPSIATIPLFAHSRKPKQLSTRRWEKVKRRQFVVEVDRKVEVQLLPVLLPHVCVCAVVTVAVRARFTTVACTITAVCSSRELWWSRTRACAAVMSCDRSVLVLCCCCVHVLLILPKRIHYNYHSFLSLPPKNKRAPETHPNAQIECLIGR